MKLYHSGGSPNSRRVRILLAEKGLEIALAPVDLGGRATFRRLSGDQPAPRCPDPGAG